MCSVEIAQTWVKEMLKKHADGDTDYSKVKIRGGNLTGEKNKLCSYGTPICVFEGNTFKMSTHKYTPTTSKHQCYAKRALPDAETCEEECVCVEYVDDVERL